MRRLDSLRYVGARSELQSPVVLMEEQNAQTRQSALRRSYIGATFGATSELHQSYGLRVSCRTALTLATQRNIVGSPQWKTAIAHTQTHSYDNRSA